MKGRDDRSPMLQFLGLPMEQAGSDLDGISILVFWEKREGYKSLFECSGSSFWCSPGLRGH